MEVLVLILHVLGVFVVRNCKEKASQLSSTSSAGVLVSPAGLLYPHVTHTRLSAYALANIAQIIIPLWIMAVSIWNACQLPETCLQGVVEDWMPMPIWMATSTSRCGLVERLA